jgi:hypothetical protein
MRLRDFNREQFKKRLDATGCLVIYDGEGHLCDRQRYLCRRV